MRFKDLGSTQTSNAYFIFSIKASTMASRISGTPTFLFPAGTNNQPNSPKSPKVTLENPLLKNPQFLLGSSKALTAAPSLFSENTDTIMSQQPRTPLFSLSMNHQKHTNRTLGPPPKASLSLMGMLPAEVSFLSVLD
jgi:hypothetical protein